MRENRSQPITTRMEDQGMQVSARSSHYNGVEGEQLPSERGSMNELLRSSEEKSTTIDTPVTAPYNRHATNEDNSGDDSNGDVDESNVNSNSSPSKDDSWVQTIWIALAVFFIVIATVLVSVVVFILHSAIVCIAVFL